MFLFLVLEMFVNDFFLTEFPFLVYEEIVSRFFPLMLFYLVKMFVSY